MGIFQSRETEAEPEPVEEPCLPEPWQKMEVGASWSAEYEKKLIDDICNHITHKELNRANIPILGPMGSGKSSFINSVASISKGVIAMPHHVRWEGSESTTIMLKKYIADGKLRNCTLLDTMGLAKTQTAGFNVQDVMYLINGNIRPNYQFNPAAPIDRTDSEKFKEKPSLADRAHCVVFVVEARSVYYMETISEETKRNIDEVQKQIYSQDIPRIILLTKIDDLCNKVRKDVAKTFHSKKIRDAVLHTRDLFKVSELTIFPIQNYSREHGLDSNMNILILFALRRMLHLASDRLKSVDDQKDT